MRRRATTPPDAPRRVHAGIAATLVACALVAVTASPAWAAPNRTVVEPVVIDVAPALPAGSIVTVTPEGQLAASTSSPDPLTVVAPDGRDVVRISAAGVDVDAGHPFAYQSRTPPGVGTRLPAGVGPGAPPRWVHVTDATSWSWFDARTWPAAVGAPAGGRPGTTQVLGTWTLPLRQGSATSVVDGRLERREPTGVLRTTVDPAPSGLSAVVSPGDDDPAVILQGPPGPSVVVLGLDDEPFLRRAADGSWEADSASRTYRLGLLHTGRPVPGGTGWVPYAPAGSASWADERLVPPPSVLEAAYTAAAPAEVWRWQIPVLLDDRRTTLTGSVSYEPGPAAAGASGSASLRLAGLGVAVGVLAAVLVLLVVRRRRLDDGTTPRPDDLVPPREGAPLP